jgi:PAS domain-containing protein
MSHKSTVPNMLRADAEAQLAHSLATESELFSNQKLLHELQVHQIELEMQNEELRRMQLALEESRDHYADPYNLAPVAYLTLTHDGLIDTINFAGLELFGAERCTLLPRRFAALVASKDYDCWYVFFVKVIKHSRRESIELTLKASNDSEFPA